MNLISAAPLWLIILLGICLIAAAIEDALRLRISNFLVVGVLVCALTAMALQGFSLPLWQNLLVFIAILLLGTAAFSAELMGGGDVKLLAALGLWVNLQGALWLLAAVFLAGGVLAIASLALRALRRSGGAPRERRIPYGIAIAAGALTVLALQHGGPVGAFAGSPLTAIKGLPARG